MIVLYALVALLGLAVGSFLNVVVWRVPQGMSLTRPPSACPRCQHPIRARDNVPVLSWLLLRGRCRDCGEPISPRYPLVELATGVLFVLAALWTGLEPRGLWLLPAYLYLVSIGVALTLIDLDVHRLPNVIVLPAWVVGPVLLALAAAGTGEWGRWVRALLAGLVLFTFYAVVHYGSRLVYGRSGGIGLGDVKLAFVLGAYLGWSGWGALAVGAFAAFLVATVFWIVLLAAGKANRKTQIPFGPWMIVGAGIGIVWGQQAWDAWTGLWL